MNEQQFRRIVLEGTRAAQVGKKASANPYAGKPALTKQADAWDSGYRQGRAGR